MDDRRNGVDVTFELVWRAGIECGVRWIIASELDVKPIGRLVEGAGASSPTQPIWFERRNMGVV
jgi:hypothetical protein